MEEEEEEEEEEKEEASFIPEILFFLLLPWTLSSCCTCSVKRNRTLQTLNCSFSSSPPHTKSIWGSMSKFLGTWWRHRPITQSVSPSHASCVCEQKNDAEREPSPPF